MDIKNVLETVVSTVGIIKETAINVRFYGLENSGICDLTQHVCDMLNINYNNLTDSEEKLFDNEFSNLETYNYECCSRIINICIAAEKTINETNCYNLYCALKNTKLHECLLLTSPSEYTKTIIAYYVLNSDDCYVSNLESLLTDMEQ